MGVKITGAGELRAALKRKADLSSVRRIVHQNGAELQAKAQRNAPVDTGTLKRSIGMEISDGGRTATVAPVAEYAPYPEFGTRFMAAQPYVGPAFREQKEQFKSDMGKLAR